MPHYLQQIAYSIEGWKALVKKPQDRIEAVRPAIEKLGGKIESAWFTFGDYDVVLIVQMPSNVDAGAIGIAFAAGGACKAVKTTPLLTVEESVEAMKKAATHLQDATPLTVGQEISGWSSLIERDLHRIEIAMDGLFDLAIGGTAVGTGLNTHPEFAQRTAQKIAEPAFCRTASWLPSPEDHPIAL
jgi:uncharacterized protein with GYD domain